MILNLDPNFKPKAGEEIAFESFTFSGGEPHLKINPNFDTKSPVFMTHRIRSFNDIGLICLAVDALQRMGVSHIELFIPYFPAARQDRLMQAGEPLSVKVNADIFNALKLQKVLVFDPHSEVTPALLNQCEVVYNHTFVQDVLKNLNTDCVLISPDGGALKKIYKVATACGGVPVVECSKVRDVKTGQLSSFKVYADDLEGRDCLIVDDICDAGGTFMGLATALKAKNAGRLFLAVSHGIFSKGTEQLAQHFDGMYCTNSFSDLNSVGLTQIPIKL
jgi:ribose-phosphate pyrophosphokinase